MELKPGLAVNRHIRLVRPLGAGGMGTVWVADHLTLQTEVAVKFIAAGADTDTTHLGERFMLEAKAAASVKSPHVVQIFDYGCMASGTPYIVMELLEGETLASRLDRTGWLSFAQCARVVRHVARALHRAHALGIVHRDIKPDNVFLCSSEDGLYAKLLDFGVAKHDSMERRGMTDPHAMVGTAEYMSREQIMSSRDVTHFTDLWALAVVAYEALTGDIPFTGDTLGMVCVSICEGTFTPPSRLRKGVPPSMDAWFERALAKDNEARFPTAMELATSFQKALGVTDLDDDDDDNDAFVPLLAPKACTKVGLSSDPKRAQPDDAQHATGDTFAPSLVVPLVSRRAWLLTGLFSLAMVLLSLFVVTRTSSRALALRASAEALTAVSPSLAYAETGGDVAPKEPTPATDDGDTGGTRSAPSLSAEPEPAEPKAAPSSEPSPPPVSAAAAPPPAPTPAPTSLRGRPDYGF